MFNFVLDFNNHKQMEFNDKQIEILHVAEQLFAEEGFDGTSVREIARIANINIAMISYYFGSKEKLLESLVMHRIASMRIELENLISEKITPTDKIDKMIELYIARINSNRAMYKILHFEVGTKKRELNLDSFTSVKKENLRLLENIIAEGQEQKIFQKNINITLIPTTIIGAVIHFDLNKHYYEDLLDLKSEEAYENYVKTELTSHIKKTIKALLLYEN